MSAIEENSNHVVESILKDMFVFTCCQNISGDFLRLPVRGHSWQRQLDVNTAGLAVILSLKSHCSLADAIKGKVSR